VKGSLYSRYRKIPLISGLFLASMAWHGAVGAASLRLSWGDISNNEDGFRIERMAADGSFVQIATVGANVTSYTDSNLTSGSTYCYVVRAFNSGGVSDASNGACATVMDPISTVNSYRATNSGSSSSSGATSSGTTSAGSNSSGSSNSSPPLRAPLGLVSDNPTFVRQQYLDFLNREPDSGGFSAWVNALNGGLPKASLIEEFMNSGEFLFGGKFIVQTYLGILTRDAEYDGFRDWLEALLTGMSSEQIVQTFLDSGEFHANFGSNLTNSQFVERMYNNVLRRSSEQVGFNFWLGQLNSGQMTRAQVGLGFLHSDEFQGLTASQNRVNVSLLYFNLLRRDPDAEGFSAWVEGLNSGVPLGSVIDGFLSSLEY
jgi:Domain of unknown function (DUF4214)